MFHCFIYCRSFSKNLLIYSIFLKHYELLKRLKAANLIVAPCIFVEPLQFINQWMHTQFPINHFKTLRHVLILSDHHQGALFLAKVILQYSQFNSYLQTRCCGSISCCVGMCCGAVARFASYDAHLATAPQHNMICCHNTSFANTNWIVNTVI